MSSSPPQLPPQQVVVVKSGCGKLAVVLAIVAGCIILAIGGCFGLGLMGLGKAVKEAGKEMKKHEAEKTAMLANVQLLDFQWRADAGGSVMIADFKIQNNGPDDLKDFEILSTDYAPSGTKIDTNSRTVYDIVKAGETRVFKDFNMGLVHSQATKSVATITNAVKVPPGTVEARPAAP